MRERLRKYVSVVMTLLLCLGLWFQHGQAVCAAQTATVNIVADDAQQSVVSISDVDISGVTLTTQTDGTIDSATGTFSIQTEQMKLNGRPSFGIYPTEERNESDKLNEQSIDASVVGITSDPSTGEIIIEIYGVYGASHVVTYDSNYQMGGGIYVTESDVYAEVSYYQDDLANLNGKYEHPTSPTFDGTTWTNSDGMINYLFKGWGLSDSGGVNAPTEFTYQEKEETSITLYAQWQAPATLNIYYYEDENATTATSTNTLTQSSASDTVFTFTTPAAPTREHYFFNGWSYDDGTGTKTVAENTSVEIAMPTDGSEVNIDVYGTWTAAESLAVTYVSNGEEVSTSEIYQSAATDTTFSFTTAAEPTAPGDNYVFDGWSYANSTGAIVSIGAGVTCSDISIDTDMITLTAVWMESVTSEASLGAGTYTLQEGTAYALGSGSWTVTYNGSGDSCTYTGGTFYVGETGDYTFAGN